MEFTCGNTLGTTVHCSYGAFWLAFATFLLPSVDIQGAYNGDQHAFSFAVGIFLILWCFLTILFLLAALRTNWIIVIVLFFLALAFLFLSIAQFISTSHPSASVNVNKAGGAFSIICAFFAFWAGGAQLMTEQTTMLKVPLFHIAGRPVTSEA